MADKVWRFDVSEVEKFEEERTRLVAMVDFEKAKGELETLEVKLPLDPTKQGLVKMHNLLSKVQDYQDRCKQHLLAAIWLRNRWETLLSRVQSLYSRRSSKVLSESEEIRSLKNVSLQNAAVESLLRREKSLLDLSESGVETAKAFLDVCRTVASNLESTDRNIARQIKVFAMQMDIGEVKTVRPPRSLDTRDL